MEVPIISKLIQCDAFSMTKSALILERNKVRHISLVHGTFAGNDALGLFDLLEPVVLQMTGSNELMDHLKQSGKRLLDQVTQDLGNFTPDYVKEFGKALDNRIDCQRFTWGSGNFHLARLKGAVELAAHLANTINQHHIQWDERLLLIGHSHAGQLFRAHYTVFAERRKSTPTLPNCRTA